MTMNKFWVLALCVLFVSCENKERKVTSDLLNFPSAENGEVHGDLPEISFEQAEFNFGKVAVGEKITHTYTFVNKGNADLQIAQVTPSCGCTTLKDWPKEPIAPGQSGVITVEFNSAGFSGNIGNEARKFSMYICIINNKKKNEVDSDAITGPQRYDIFNVRWNVCCDVFYNDSSSSEKS